MALMLTVKLDGSVSVFDATTGKKILVKVERIKGKQVRLSFEDSERNFKINRGDVNFTDYPMNKKDDDHVDIRH